MSKNNPQNTLEQIESQVTGGCCVAAVGLIGSIVSFVGLVKATYGILQFIKGIPYKESPSAAY